MRAPSYDGRGLVNLVAEVELRLSGTSASAPLASAVAEKIPPASTYVVVLIDGLGVDRLGEVQAAALRESHAATLDAPFPCQTAVATATLATGLPASAHGLMAYLLFLEEAGGVVNCLWWFRLDGVAADIDLGRFLPSPNLAERLATGGIEAVVVEPAAYLGSPLDRVLYRGARTRGVDTVEDIAAATIDEASQPGRLVLAYLPQVDAAGHATGLRSAESREALAIVADAWSSIVRGLPSHAVALGIADHGMMEPVHRIAFEPPEGLVVYGDSRTVLLKGDVAALPASVHGLPLRVIPGREARSWWGPAPRHPRFDRRMPDALLVAAPGVVVEWPGNETPLAGYHGGLSDQELKIPLLVAGAPG